MGKDLGNNKVEIVGTITEEFTFSHEAHGEKFCRTKIASKRLSGAVDVIPVIVSSLLADTESEWKGKRVRIVGTFRSHNTRGESRTHLILFVFADSFVPLDADEHLDENKIHLDGYICKDVNYRKTPLGREITDVLLAVNRPYGKSDYIPCVVWGRNARFASVLNVGDLVSVNGRVQSREYQKRIDEETSETRVAYEVSITSITNDDEQQEGCDE